MSKNKNKKNTGFIMYMLERRPGILASGEKLPGGMKDLANLVGDDWEKLSKEEKEVYHERAKARNQQDQKKGIVGGSIQSQRDRERAAQEKLYLEARRQREQLKKEIQDANRTRVLKIFEDKESWMEHPVVVCSFNSYYKPDVTDHPYLPAEIGLSTFSLKEGVCDNFARVINTLEIPKGYGIDAMKHTEYLGIPMPGPANEFSDFEGVMAIIENYLEKYQGNFNQEDGLCVFGLDTDYDLITGCFNWLQEKAKTKLTIHVLSLPLFGYLASTEANQFFRKEWINGSVDDWNSDSVKWMGKDAIGPPTSVYTNVSSNRKIGEPFNSQFIYSGQHPLTQYGLFNTIRQVDELLVNSENYKFYDELACVYHFRTAEMIHHCALNQANRYAFYLLEVLTISNVVEIIPGAHYPHLENREEEVARRHNWLKEWGITKVEENMKDPPPPMKITEHSSVYEKNAIRILNKKDDRTRHDFTVIPEGEPVGRSGLAVQVIVNRDPEKAAAHLERNKTEMLVDIGSNDPDVNPFQGMQYPPFFHCRASGDIMFPIKLSTITERKEEEEQDLIDLFTVL